MLHHMAQMCTKEVVGFLGKVFTPRLNFQGSRISVWFHCHVVDFFFPGNCSFQALILTFLKELALHEPKSLAPVK